MHRRLWLILLGFVAALASVALLMPALLGDHVRQAAITLLERNIGKKVEIRRLAVTLFPSVRLRVDDFGIDNPPLFPPGQVLRVARIDAQMDPWALLRRRVVLRSLQLESPTINLISDPDGPWNFETPRQARAARSFTIEDIAHVRITHGHILVSNLLRSDAAGPVFFEAHDVVSELENVNADALANPGAKSLDGYGTLQAGMLRFGAIEATQLRSAIRLEARRVSFTEVDAKTYGGDSSGQFSIKFGETNASFEADAQMQRIDVARLLAAFPAARGKMTGSMAGKLGLAGEFKHTAEPLASLRGSGKLTVRDGQAPSLRLNANLMRLAHYNDLGPAKNDPSSFNSISLDLELAHERLSSQLIDIDGYGVDVDGSGSVSLSGSNELALQGVAAIVSKQGIVTQVMARLAGGTVKDGKLQFPFHISGTLDSPVFSKGR